MKSIYGKKEIINKQKIVLISIGLLAIPVLLLSTQSNTFYMVSLPIGIFLLLYIFVNKYRKLSWQPLLELYDEKIKYRPLTLQLFFDFRITDLKELHLENIHKVAIYGDRIVYLELTNKGEISIDCDNFSIDDKRIVIDYFTDHFQCEIESL